MKKTLVVILFLMLPLALTWAAGEDVKPEVDNEGIAITPVKDGNILDSTNPIPEPPVITQNLLTQNFESVWDPTTPPAGWTIIDNGTEGDKCWWYQDWYTYYNSTAADTVARFYYYPAMESLYNEWLITPDVALPGGATACSLTFRHYYNDYSTNINGDTAYIKISTDAGSNWTTLATYGADNGTSSLLAVYIPVTSYAGQTVRVAFHLRTFANSYSYAYEWQVDRVKIIADASTLLNEEFSNWGPFGNNPPSGWTIIDDGTPYAAQTAWNLNDWLKTTYWSSGTARIYYVSTYAEWQDDWVISPTFAIAAGNACTLSVVEYYYRSTTTLRDHGYIKVSTDGGSTWPNIIADHTATLGSSSTKTTFKYDLSAFNGLGNLKVAFNFVNDPSGSDDWRIDDVSVDEYLPPTQDPGVVSIDAPLVLIYTGGSYTITATVTEAAVDSTIIDSVLFKVDTGTVNFYSNTIYPAVYLQGYASQQFSSSTQWNPTADDWYTVSATVYGSGDQNPLNNTYSTIRVTQGLLAYPFIEDFEGGIGTSIWEWVGFGTGFGYTTSNYHSPDTALWFSYSGYPNERIAVSPPIYVSGSSVPLFKFWEKESSSAGPSGDETHTIGLVAGDWDWANFDTIFFEDSSSILSNVYRESSAYPGPLEGDTVRIVIWYHNTTVAAWNWYVDDISLKEWATDEIAATSIDDPSGTIFTGTTISPKGTFTSNGIVDQTIDAVMTIEDTATTIVSVIYADTVTSVVVESLGTYQVTFADWIVPEGDGETYTFTMEAINPGDQDTTNNVISAEFDALTHYSEGGPDDYGYRWIDNVSMSDEDPPVYSWVDISTVGQLVTWTGSTDEGRTWVPLGLPGGFWYYGNFYDSVCMGTNAWMALVNQSTNYMTNYKPPSASAPRTGIFPTWDDMIGRSPGKCYYYPDTTNNRFIVSWLDWEYYATPYNPHDFQVILDLDDSTVVMQFGPGTGTYQTDITVGIQDSTQTSGLAYYFDGTTNPGNLPFDGLAIKYYFAPPAIDAALTSIDKPGALVYNGTTVTPTATVTNNGEFATTVDVTFRILDNTQAVVYNQTETTVSIPGAGGTTQHAFATTWNANTDGAYSAIANVTLVDDGNPANDTTTLAFYVGTHYSTGGPDEYGYRWIDNFSLGEEDPPVFNYIDISTTGDSLTAGDGGGSARVLLGFSFPYYGLYYDSMWVANDGYIEFEYEAFTLTNDCPLPNLTTPNVPMITIFWDDMYLRTVDNAKVLGKYFDDVVDYYVIQWHNVTRYGQYGDPMDFEIILYENGKILCQYLDINNLANGQGQSATVGLEDDAIPSGISYLCNDDRKGNRLIDSLAVKWYYEPWQHDVAAVQFNAPGAVGLVNVAITPEVLFDNKGVNDEINVPVYLVIDPGGYADTQTIALLDSGTAVAQQFDQFTPTLSGIYTLTAICAAVGDQDPTNDTLVTTYTVFDGIFDFESGPGPLIAGGGSTGVPPDFNGDWEWGVPYGGTYGPATAYSPTHCWGMNLDGPVSLPGYSDTCWSYVDFQLDVGTGNNAIFGYFEWYVLHPSSYYDSAFVIINSVDIIRFFRGSNPTWHYMSHDLSAYTGVIDVRFYEKKTLSGIDQDGWYFDDFTFINCELVAPEIDVTPLVIQSSVDPLEADTVEVTISNTGEGTLFFNVIAEQDPFIAGNGSNQPSPLGNNNPVEPLGYRPAEVKDADPKADALYRQELAAAGIETKGNERYQALEPYYPPVIDESGGPDIYGYLWIDSDEPFGPDVTWKDISSTGTQVVWVNTSTDDHYSARIPIGFTFNFYGQPKTYLYVSENGVLSFDSLTSGWSSNNGIPSTSGPENMIAIWWDDLAQATGSVKTYFDSTDSTFTISFISVQNYLNGGNLNFQAVLHTDGNIDLNYGTMNPGADNLLGATIGTENAAGDDGLQIVYNAAYMHDNLSILVYLPIPWLSASISSGSIDPGGANVPFDVIMDASLVPVGIYTGTVTITSNDPDEFSINIPITFIVGGLGTVSGQVTDANTTDPIEGAIVTATWVSATRVVDTTDSGGNYSMAITPGTVNMTVEAAGYVTNSQNVVVVEDQTTTHNVALTAPIATIDVSPVVDTVTVGDTSLYTKFLYNTGTAPLDYSVSLSFGGGGLLGLNMNRTELVQVYNDVKNVATEYAPYATRGDLPIITDFADTVFWFDSQVPTNDNGCLGVEFDGTYFWVTGRNASGGDVHKLHKFDRNGNLITSYNQGTTSTWGWRDLAWDGTYLYAGDENEFAKINPATGAKVGTLPWPTALTVVRGLAYDPITDHFWSADFSTNIFEFDRTGTVINQYPNSYSVYGMAWDDASEGGPFIWTWYQTTTGTIKGHAAQFSPASGTYTGVAFDAVLPPGYDTTLAGGACLTTQWQPGLAILFTMNQAYPTDHVLGYEIAVTETWLSVASGGSGTVAPDDSAEIVFMVDFRDSAIVVDSTYEADANIENNSTAPTPVIPFAITAAAAGCDYIVGDVNGSNSFNGLDVTYGVAFFKGGPPPMCVDCPLCPGWWYCGDVNGSCSYNGLDITYAVAYFKGGPAPIPCDDCPPLGPAMTLKGKDFKPAVQPAVESKSKSKKESQLKR